MNNSTPLLQVMDLHVTEKDIEKEHHNQLRRWKETHGDLQSKSPPRMHGAKAIMTAEPPRVQDLRPRPNIKVESFLPPKPDEERGPFDQNSTAPLPPVVNPGYLQPDPSPLLKHTTVDGSKESVSSTEHDTYL